MHNVFAVIGAGPAGLYAADRILRTVHGSHVDVFEKNPVPMGLLRYGVAPDHPSIKRVQTSLDRILDNPRLRLFTGVHVGVGRGASSHADPHNDLTLSELRAGYTAVIIATGSSHGRRLVIPGSDAVNFHDAADFTAWYNSAPGAPTNWDLTTPIVAVIGGGNVALDVTRMLLCSPEELEKTDVAPSVINRYVHSAVSEVHVFVRRGPAQAKWDARQLRDLRSMPNITLNFDDRDFVQCADELEAPDAAQPDHSHKAVLRMMERLDRAERDDPGTDPDPAVDPAAARLSSAQDRQVYFHFYSQPVEVPTDDDGEVTGLVTDRTHVDASGHAAPDGEDQRTWHLSAVYSAIGYQPDGLGSLPLEPATGALLNKDGRLVSPDGRIVRGVYATGWARRGARGLVADTQTDAHALGDLVAADVLANELPDPADPLFDPITVLRSRGVRYGGIDGWRRVEQAERQAGIASSRQKAKISDMDELERLSVARPDDQR